MVYEYTLDEAFPAVSVDLTPTLNRILVQVREPRKKTAGGIIFSPTDMDANRESTSIVKVLAVGPLAFKRTGKGVEWYAEGDEPKVGDYVAINKFAGDSFAVPTLNGQKVQLRIVEDRYVIGTHIENPLDAAMFSQVF